MSVQPKTDRMGQKFVITATGEVPEITGPHFFDLRPLGELTNHRLD